MMDHIIHFYKVKNYYELIDKNHSFYIRHFRYFFKCIDGT